MDSVKWCSSSNALWKVENCHIFHFNTINIAAMVMSIKLLQYNQINNTIFIVKVTVHCLSISDSQVVSSDLNTLLNKLPPC